MQNPILVGKLPNGQLIYVADPDPVTPPPPPSLPVGTILLGLGPNLFIDPYLLESPGFNRIVHSPARTRTTPILNGKSQPGPFRVTNYSHSVIYDPVNRIFTMWYLGLEISSGKTLNAVTYSADGIAWDEPLWLFTPDATTVGGSALGTVIEQAPPAPRYMTILPAIDENPAGPAWKGIAWQSDNGIQWTRAIYNPIVPNAYGEEWTPFLDGRGLIHRWNKVDYTWKDSAGKSHTNTTRNAFVRCIGLAGAYDGNAFAPSTLLFAPGAADVGETQFYYVSNIIKRGDLLIGAMGILREDLVASGNAPAGAFGTGYTTLVWSRDGVNWNRYDGMDPHFFDPSSLASDWDHAIVWISSLVPVGDDVLLYYGGYQWGHKVGTDRQIGVLRIKRDRFVSRHASAETVLRTKLVNFNAHVLSVNYSGNVRVKIVDENLVSIPGFDYTLTGDSVETDVFFTGDLSSLSNRAVHLEFWLTNADLYAFYLK